MLDLGRMLRDLIRGQSTRVCPPADAILAERRLAEAGRALASSLDLQQVLDRGAALARDLMAADVAGLWLSTRDQPHLTLGARAGSHETPAPLCLAQGSGLAACVLAGPAALAIEDIEDDPRLEDRAWFAAEHVRSLLAVPLLADDAALGILICLTRTRRRWSADDRRRAEALAATAALAIRNARIHGESQERLRQSETFLAVGRAVNSTLDFYEAMRRVARETGRALGADMVGAYILDRDRELLRPVAGYHVPPELLQRFMDVPFRLDRNEAMSEACRSRQPAWVLDASADPRTDPALTAWIPMRTVVFFPLTVKDETIGGLFLIWWSVRTAPTPAELSLLEGIARQMALAIANAQLFEARGRDAHQLHALNEISRSLVAIREPRELFASITKLAADLLDASLVRLWLFDPAPARLQIAASGGADADAAGAVDQLAPGDGIAGRVFLSRHPEFLADAPQDPRLLDRAMIQRLGLHGFAAVPLILEDDVAGVLVVLTRRRGDFPPSQQSLLEAFAAQSALVIHNARTFAALERSLRETQALLGVAESFGSTRDIGEIMRRVCREAVRALGADSAVFYTVDEPHATVLSTAGYHVPPTVKAHAGGLSGGPVAALFLDAFRSRQVVFIPDVESDPRLRDRPFKDITVRSALNSPVYFEDRGFGLLVLYWWHTVRDISPQDLTLTAALSAQAGLALENARLLAESHSRAAALLAKNAELDSFVYTVSHDLKSPLVTIQGMAGLVLKDHAAAVDPDGRHYLERILANTRHMERLLLDLLALSRVGREAHEPEPIDPASTVADILAELAGSLRDAGITVTVGPLPPLWAIRVQLEQVFRNLLTNAIKYMGPAPAPAIAIGALTRGDVVECWVRDTGVGIDPAYHEKIFELFQRLNEVAVEGTGVGLPIVKKIVEAAGGRVWVESAPGHGSTFRFTWPMRPVS
jgi:GAF domain-containing protein